MMLFADIAQMVQEKFGKQVLATQSSALDPYLVLEVGGWPSIALWLRDDPRLQMDILNCISFVDYLETEPSKVAKAGFEPHVEVVYHLSSFVHRHRLVIKLLLPRWKG
ncbi:MAG TPA: NADH-quinone oxidoreductase subunit C, partial [Gemmatales bacterium]|nr:NADH-quinone oxidoreductase subunit C [Gemmatales bacterium]